MEVEASAIESRWPGDSMGDYRFINIVPRRSGTCKQFREPKWVSFPKWAELRSLARLHPPRLAHMLLVQSPHPVVAAVAKGAAQKLGVEPARVGAITEVAPFLHDLDVDALGLWVNERR